MPGKPYFGPERRKSERRKRIDFDRPREQDHREERRQEAHKTFVTNMGSEDMLVLKRLHQKYESLGPIAKAAMLSSMTYDEIIAREA